MSANPQQSEELKKLLNLFSDDDCVQHIYLEETNLYFYLTMYGVLVLMIRKSDLQIVHQEYMAEQNLAPAGLSACKKVLA